jgi:Tfp pilus assembly protein PilO
MEDNARLQREAEALKTRLNDAEGAAGELTELRGERDQIRTRVAEMLQQLDALNL